MRPVRLLLPLPVVPNRRVSPPETTAALFALLLAERLATLAHFVGLGGLADGPVGGVTLAPCHEPRLEGTPRRRVRRRRLALAGSPVGLRRARLLAAGALLRFLAVNQDCEAVLDENAVS